MAKLDLLYEKKTGAYERLVFRRYAALISSWKNKVVYLDLLIRCTTSIINIFHGIKVYNYDPLNIKISDVYIYVLVPLFSGTI